MHSLNAIGGLGIALAVTLVFITAACSSGSSPPAAPPSYQDKLTCQTLASATSAVASGGYGIGGGNAYTPTAQEQVIIWQEPANTVSPSFRRDLLNVVGNPAHSGYGLYEPSPQDVSTLQADCAALGVNGSIWPATLTTLP